MQVYTDLTEFKMNYAGSVVALGTFDGVHIGHRKIIQTAVTLAKQLKVPSVVFTFSNHPLTFICPEKAPLQILSSLSKIEQIEKLEVDILLNISFTPELLSLSPTDFIQLLTLKLRPIYLVVGPNYTFGYKGVGTPDFLNSMAEAYNYKVKVPEAVTSNNQLVSSTLIRQMIKEGNIQKANQLLGAPFTIIGTVVEGDKVGRQIGFPTANLDIPMGMIVPCNGVYAAKVAVHNHQYNALLNIGTNPTFGEKNRRLEAYLLDFSGNLYGQDIAVSLLHRLRGEIRFPSVEQLQHQIAIDVQEARKIL